MASRVELLFFDGCPSHAALLPRLRALVAAAGDDPDGIVQRRIETPEEAESERFLGSPTVRVDGEDVEPSAGARDDVGLKCRLYRSEGTQSGLPPDAWIAAALERRRGGGATAP